MNVTPEKDLSPTCDIDQEFYRPAPGGGAAQSEGYIQSDF